MKQKLQQQQKPIEHFNIMDAKNSKEGENKRKQHIEMHK